MVNAIETHKFSRVASDTGANIVQQTFHRNDKIGTEGIAISLEQGQKTNFRGRSATGRQIKPISEEKKLKKRNKIIKKKEMN